MTDLETLASDLEQAAFDSFIQDCLGRWHPPTIKVALHAKLLVWAARKTAGVEPIVWETQA